MLGCPVKRGGLTGSDPNWSQLSASFLCECYVFEPDWSAVNALLANICANSETTTHLNQKTPEMLNTSLFCSLKVVLCVCGLVPQRKTETAAENSFLLFRRVQASKLCVKDKSPVLLLIFPPSEVRGNRCRRCQRCSAPRSKIKLLFLFSIQFYQQK